MPSPTNSTSASDKPIRAAKKRVPTNGALAGELALLQLDPEDAKDPAIVKEALAKLREEKKAEAEARRKERDALIARVINEEGDQALESIHPMVLRAKLVEGAASVDAFLRPICELNWELNPLFDAVLLKCGASKRGARTYAMQMHAKGEKNNLIALLKALPNYVVYDGATCDKLQRKGGHKIGWAASWEVKKKIQETPLGKTLSFADLKAISPDNNFYANSKSPLLRAMICITVTGSEMFIKVLSACDEENQELQLYTDAPDMHLWRRNDTKDPITVTADVALAMIGAARGEGLITDVDKNVDDLQSVLEQSFIGQAVAAAPGEARVVVGSKVKKPSGVTFEPLFPGCTFAESTVTSALEAGRLIEKATVSNKALHGSVADVMAMEMAPLVKYDGLYDHQNEAVRRHLATNIGFLNACSVGLGKSIMTAVGLRERAKMIGPSHLTLVSARNSLVGQWLSELGRWFPDAHVFLGKSTNTKRIKEVLEAHADDPRPLVMVCSYGVAKKNLDLFRQYRWNDMIVDEAAFLKNRSTAQSQTFWALREYADIAIALTGTPIDKGLDDLGSMLSWVRADESMFYARRLSTRYDISNADQLAKLHRAIGPVLYRVDTDELNIKMPSYQTHVEMVVPHKDELKLAEGARKQLKKMLLDNQQVLKDESAKATAEGDTEMAEAYDDAYREMKSAQAGTLLGGVTLARMSASDAVAVANSESLGAAVLEQAGLVAPAVKNGGSKRRKVVEDVVDRVQNKGLGVLVFTDFVPAAISLVHALNEAGVTAVRFGGKTPEEIESCKADFQGTPCKEHASEPQARPECPSCVQPTTDVLVLGQSGQEGLNLQRAGVLVNYDLNWVPSRFLQRVGRASRIGSLHDTLEILIYLVEGTIEERVAAVLVPRAMEALAALDLARGVEAKSSVLSGLSQQIAVNISQAEQDAAADKSIFEMAKEIVLAD